jgi:hypothetical protein
LIKNISPTPPNARDDQPRTSVPQLSLRRSVNPPGRGPLHFCMTSVVMYITCWSFFSLCKPSKNIISPQILAVLLNAPQIAPRVLPQFA